MIEQNKSLTGKPISDEERVNYLGDIAWLEMKRILFGDYVQGAGVAAAFREAAPKP